RGIDPGLRSARPSFRCARGLPRPTPSKLAFGMGVGYAWLPSPCHPPHPRHLVAGSYCSVTSGNSAAKGRLGQVVARSCVRYGWVCVGERSPKMAIGRYWPLLAARRLGGGWFGGGRRRILYNPRSMARVELE